MSASVAIQGERKSLILKVTSAAIALPTLAVILRFWSRAVGQRGRVGWDDWTCLLALLFNCAISGLGIAWVLSGFERPSTELSPQQVEFSLEMLFGTYFIFGLSIGIHKTSALFFYSRVFHNQSRKLTWAIWVGHGLVVIWYIYAVLQNSFSCIPTRMEWDSNVHGHCTSYIPVYLFTGIFDCVIDLYILILPLPVVYKLQMKWTKKALIAVAMILGYCCLITSLGRLITTMNATKLPNESMALKWNTGNVAIWTVLEPAVGVISVCTPSWWPLFSRVHRLGFKALFSTKTPGAESQIMAAHQNGRRMIGSGLRSGSDTLWSQTEQYQTFEGEIITSKEMGFVEESAEIKQPEPALVRLGSTSTVGAESIERV